MNHSPSVEDIHRDLRRNLTKRRKLEKNTSGFLLVNVIESTKSLSAREIMLLISLAVSSSMIPLERPFNTVSYTI